MEKLRIAGSTINLESADLKKVESLEDLQKLEIFDHLDEDQKQEAEAELLQKLQA